jgi:hypothetical protein
MVGAQLQFSRQPLETEDHRRAAGATSIFGESVVAVAVQPAFTGLSRRDDRMTGGTGVLCGMPIRRTVATKGDAALLAGSKVDPSIANLDALRTFQTLRMLD